MACVHRVQVAACSHAGFKLQASTGGRAQQHAQQLLASCWLSAGTCVIVRRVCVDLWHGSCRWAEGCAMGKRKVRERQAAAGGGGGGSSAEGRVELARRVQAELISEQTTWAGNGSQRCSVTGRPVVIRTLPDGSKRLELADTTCCEALGDIMLFPARLSAPAAMLPFAICAPFFANFLASVITDDPRFQIAAVRAPHAQLNHVESLDTRAERGAPRAGDAHLRVQRCAVPGLLLPAVKP